MNLKTFLPELRNRFEQYAKGFVSPDPNIQAALDLKHDHTHRVCENILDIGEHEGLGDEDLHMAEATALLHDIGRFEQFMQYKTFSDVRSENHAILGVRVIRENEILKGIDSQMARTIIRAVEYHNRAALPSRENGRDLFFMKLLRDADKVDIWRVVTDYYGDVRHERNPTIELNLPDTPDISDAVYRSLLKGEIVQMKDLGTLNDFKLLQIGWIYDVNFRRTFQMVREKRYLEQIRETLPSDSLSITTVYEKSLAYLNLKANKRQGDQGQRMVS
ncbi:MAG: HD domain-containing protein [Deltaproteobacteria bacterium]|nr:HD domain-containing protein [Deltaproteobacteria bacterium]